MTDHKDETLHSSVTTHTSCESLLQTIEVGTGGCSKSFQLGWKHRFRNVISLNLVLSYCLRMAGCFLSLQFARLETYQVGNAISPTWFADCSMIVAFS